MDAKTYLEQYSQYKKLIVTCGSELNQEKTLFEEAAASGASDDMLKKMQDSMNTLSDEVVKYLEGLKDIHNILFRIPLDKGHVIHVLHMRYIQGKSWKEICSEASESMRQVQRYHAQGLKYIDKFLNMG